MSGTESTDGTPPGPDPPVPSSPSQPPPAWPPVAYWVRTTLAVVATLAVLAAARRVSHILLIVVIAFVLAVGLDPAVRPLERLRLKRGWGVALIFAGLALFFLLFAVLLVPPMAKQIRQFAAAVPSYVEHLETRATGSGPRHDTTTFPRGWNSSSRKSPRTLPGRSAGSWASPGRWWGDLRPVHRR